MAKLFLTLLSMSATASVVILLVLLVRLALRKAPKVFSYALWAAVLLRLLCPYSIPNPWSRTPTVRVEPADDTWSVVTIDVERAMMTIRVDDFPVGRPEVKDSFAQESSAPGIADAPAPDEPVRQIALRPSFWGVAGLVWLTGTALIIGYGALSLLLLRPKLVGSVPLEGERDVRLADHIPSPFVLGLVRPKIYLPSDLPEGERDYILLHERTHIRRFDHIFRTLAWLALAAHWFNPLVWLAFHLAGKDMEMSCDEVVLRKMGREIRADYSTSLLRLSQGGRLPAGPLAFGGGDTQGRIKNILRYQKPALWVVAAALIAVLAAGIALATSPADAAHPPEPGDELSVSTDRNLAQISGHSHGFTLQEGTVWEDGDPWGALYLPYPPFDSGGIRGMAEVWWADLDRTSVTVSTSVMASLSDGPSGYYIFTVALTEEGGTVTDMRRVGSGTAYPQSIPEAEAVRLARVADIVMRAARSVMAATWASAPSDYQGAESAPFYFQAEPGLTRIGGVGNAFVTWSRDTSPSRCNLYFAHDPAFCCPRLAGKAVEGSAVWTDESKSALSVVFNVNDSRVVSGTIAGFYVHFVVELGSGTVTRRDFESLVEGETLELTDQEMTDMARTLAGLMIGAEAYYLDVSGQSGPG